MLYQDDGWWASVLAEEESQTAIPALKTQKSEESGKACSDWERAMSLFLKDEIVSLEVTGHNRGGVLVEAEDLSGFVPCSHLLDMAVQFDGDCREEFLSNYVGRTLRLKIIECVPEEGRLIFSERAARAEAGKRPELFSSIRIGQRLKGEVTNVTEFGIFVDLGGVEGLIHISELSWGRVSHPNQICKIGQQVEVLVMEIAPERCRIAYPVNRIVPAVVTALVAYGVFARLEEGLEGLIHASEIPLPPEHEIKDILSTGQIVQVRILQVEATRQRLSLSMKLGKDASFLIA
jgi:small subunit ribosomal protein S1